MNKDQQLLEDLASHLQSRLCGIMCEKSVCDIPDKLLKNVLYLLACYPEEDVRELINKAGRNEL